MKTLYKSIKIAVGVFLLSMLVVSCLPDQQSIGDAGQTLVKLWPSDYNMLAVDAKTTAQTGVLFEVRRDANSQATLNSSSTVVLTYDTDGSVLTAYNKDNETNYIPLPSNLATVSPALTGGKVTLEFGPGEFSKSVNLDIPNSASFDFSKSYALAFTLTEVSGTGKLSEASGKTIVAEVLSKNKWDGKYTVTGTFVDYTAGSEAWTGIYPKAVNLETSGALTVKKYDTDYAVYGYIFETGTGASQFGAWTPAFTFDANNNVTAVVNTSNDPLPRQRTAVLYTGPGSINKYDPVKKTLDVSYQLKQLTVNPQLRNLIKEHYEYKGPR